MVAFVFFDTNIKLIEEYKKILKSKKISILFVTGDIDSVLDEYKYDAIISSGNSLI